MALAVLVMAASTLRAGAGRCAGAAVKAAGKCAAWCATRRSWRSIVGTPSAKSSACPATASSAASTAPRPAATVGLAVRDGSCDAKCDACGRGKCDHGLGAKKFVWRDTIPGCAKILLQKKLLKKVEKKKVKTYKWVLEDLCGKCRDGCDSAVVPEGTPVPPVPEEAEAEDVTAAASSHGDGSAQAREPAFDRIVRNPRLTRVASDRPRP